MERAVSLRRSRSALVSLIVAALALVLATGANAADISGIWWIKDRTEVAKLDHAKLPFTPEGAAAYKQNLADIASGKGLAIEHNKCLPPGVPRLMLARYPFQILQTPAQVTFVHEKMHLVRLIYIDKPHPDDIDLTYEGSSTGKWDGDALVVDTISLKDNTVIDKTGIPHSDQLHVTERFSLKDGGKTLLDQVTMEDPKVFTKPVSFDISFAKHPEAHLMQDVCSFGPPMRDTLQGKR
jgi:hypothetical protein